MSAPAEHPSRPGRRLLIDLTPLRRSRDFRRLVAGELISVLGNQLTTVAVPYQVYQLTRSSLVVGLVSTTQLFPLIAGSLLAGSVVDAMDRRRLLMVAQVLMAGCSAGLAVNADLGPALWPLFVLPALAAGFSGLDSAGRNAIMPNMVRRSEVSTASAIFQVLFQLGAVAGPALAGLLLAGAGVRFVYWMDVVSFGLALVAVFLISPQPPGNAGHRPGLRSILEGLRFVRGRQAIQGAYLIDINAMVFGMPRALFPALATTFSAAGQRPSASCTRRPAWAPWPGRSRPAGSAGFSARAWRSSSRSSPGAPPSPASDSCRGCPPPWPCSPSRAAPMSSRRSSAARSSSLPCQTRCGDAWRACRSPWSPEGLASETWRQGRWRPPSATPYRSFPAAWPASRAPWCWPGCCPASASSAPHTAITARWSQPKTRWWQPKRVGVGVSRGLGGAGRRSGGAGRRRAIG